MKEQVIIEVLSTEDSFPLIKVYSKKYGYETPPSNCDTGYFYGEIDEELFEEWEVVEDNR